jgi:CRP-like cAMP-binding protein
LALALQREDFYDRAAGDLTLLQEVVRVLAKRLRSLVSDRPEEARVENEGIEKPSEAPVEGEPVPAPTAGAALTAAALGQTQSEAAPGESAKPTPDGEEV